MADKDAKTGRFLTGNTASPGRPIGTRRELAREFLEDMRKIWAEKGADVLARVVEEDPATFLRSMVAIMPKELDVNVTHYDEMSDDQLRQQFVAALREARALGVDIGDGGASSVH